MSISAKAKRIGELAQAMQHPEINELARQIYDEATLAEVQYVQITDPQSGVHKAPVVGRRSFEFQCDSDLLFDSFRGDRLKADLSQQAVLIVGMYVRDFPPPVSGQLEFSIASERGWLVGERQDNIVDARKAYCATEDDVKKNIDQTPLATDEMFIRVTWKDKPVHVNHFRFGFETLIIGVPPQ